MFRMQCNDNNGRLKCDKYGGIEGTRAKLFLCRSHEILSRGNEIIMTFERVINSFPRDNIVVRTSYYLVPTR